MAKQTVCDQHLAQGEIVPGTTEDITINGEHFEVDLCSECHGVHIAPVQEFLTKFTARPAVTETKVPRQKRGGKTKARTPDVTKVRAWAAENGIEVPAKGRVRKDVVDQYLAAHS